MTNKILEKQKKLDQSRKQIKIVEKNQILLENELKKQRKLTKEALRMIKQLKSWIKQGTIQIDSNESRKCIINSGLESIEKSLNPSINTHQIIIDKQLELKEEYEEKVMQLQRNNEKLERENKLLQKKIEDKDKELKEIRNKYIRVIDNLEINKHIPSPKIAEFPFDLPERLDFISLNILIFRFMCYKCVLVIYILNL